MSRASDPYRTLGVSRSASDAELRAAYRKLVLLHHPDHNGGSVQSARRFEEVQDAYAEVGRLRRSPGSGDRLRARPTSAGTSASGSGGSDSGLDARLAAMERELKAARNAQARAARQARDAYQQALRDAREAAAAPTNDPNRPSDEELGYISTSDSFSKIVDDAVSGLGERLSGAWESPAAKRVSERIDEARKSPAARKASELIDDLTSKLTGEPPDR